jgi:hypothetical protein
MKWNLSLGPGWKMRRANGTSSTTTPNCQNWFSLEMLCPTNSSEVFTCKMAFQFVGALATV